jgi:lauroyl/myristoyl acyltransferase
MAGSQQRRQLRSETIRSAALFLKEITVTEAEGSRGHHLLSGTRLKALLFPVLHWALRHTSAGVALVPVRLLVWAMRLLYRWPGNPLRLSCEAICRVAARPAHRHEPRQIYRQFLINALAVMENYFHLFRYGIDQVAERITLAPQDGVLIRDLAELHGGVILAVPHNIASAFSSLKLNQAFPLLVVARNSPTIARTRIALDFFERMQVPVLMVRGGNPFELSRNLFSVLKTGKVVAATLDNLDNTDKRVVVQMFGQRVGLAGWAAKIAARMDVPLLPCYFQSRGKQNTVVIGKPIIPTDSEAAVQHYASFFEQQILTDPASWAYLADKRWRRILVNASVPRH